MKILQIVTGLQEASGVTTFVKNVVSGLRTLGHEVTVVTKSGEVDVSHLSPRPDIVHIHGLWTPWLHRWSRVAARAGVPVVWSTHGMTAPWSLKHKWWKKCLPWYLYQKWDLKHAVAIHCTTDLEVEWNAALGFHNCFVAPLGTSEGSSNVIEVPSEVSKDKNRHLKVLFVGRIYPVKGLMNLVRAAALIKQSERSNNRTIRFRIVGPDQAGHQAELMKLAEELGVSQMFEWPGPKFGGALSAEYAHCDLLVLPSFTENFGGVVIDALAHGKPVIASKFTPWKVLEEAHCGWWIGNDPEAMAAALREALSTSVADLDLLGRNGRALVEEHYTWSAVCDKIIESYERIR